MEINFKNNMRMLFVAGILSVSTTTIAVTNKYRLMLRNDPATSNVIGWNQVSGNNATVYYGTTDFGTNWASYPSNKTIDRQISYAGMNNCFARLSGLQANTVYFFVIRDSEGTSQRFSFKTLPNSPTTRLSIIAGGDSRNNRTPRQNANRLVAKLRPHAVMFGGDMTDTGSNTQWSEWFDDWQLTIATDGRMFPVIATRGNHESSNAMIENLFDVPSPNVYYALTLGGSLVRAYTLNTEITISGTQTTWLSNDLAANSGVTWKIAQYHKPMRPHVSSKAEGNNQYTYWAGLFQQHGVKLIVESDAHTTKCTWPVVPSTGSGNVMGFVRDDANGSVYVGEGCWGAPLRSADDNKTWTRNSAMFNHFNWIFIDQDKIEVRTINVDNATNVGSVTDANIFQAPSNLNIWTPSNGALVTINKNATPPPPTGPSTVTISKRITAGNDDVEESQTGSMYMNSSDMELVNDGTTYGNQKIGLRFTGLTIPKGATIINAYIQFACDETGSTATSLTIKGENVDNSAAFTTASSNVSSRVQTSAFVTWAPSAWSTVGQAGTAQRTPEIKTIIQGIVNRTGWASGNALSIIITGTGKRTAEAFEGSASLAPQLVVVYSTGTSARYAANENETQSDENAISTGISNSTNGSPEIKVYPNPFSDIIVCELHNMEINKTVKVLVFDIQGKIVLHEELTSNEGNIEINTEKLNSGVYYLKVENAQHHLFKKIVKP